jgi:hypothetical protein
MGQMPKGQKIDFSNSLVKRKKLNVIEREQERERRVNSVMVYKYEDELLAS